MSLGYATPTSQLLHLERLAFDVPADIDERTEVGPLENIVLALGEFAEERGLGASQVIVRHMDPDEPKVDRLRWNIVPRKDVLGHAALLDAVSLIDIETSLRREAPTLGEDLTVFAGGIILSSPTPTGDRFMELTIAERHSDDLVREARNMLGGLSTAVGTEIRTRIYRRPDIRLAWVKEKAPEGFAEELLGMANEELRHPLRIRLAPVLPLLKSSGELEEGQIPSSAVPETVKTNLTKVRKGVEFIRTNLRIAERYESEARARGYTASGSIELETARKIRWQAEANIELLGHLMDPPGGAVNWYEVILDTDSDF